MAGGAGGLLVVLFVRPSRGRLAGAGRRQTSVGEETQLGWVITHSPFRALLVAPFSVVSRSLPKLNKSS